MRRNRRRSVNSSEITNELDTLLAAPVFSAPAPLSPLEPFDLSLDDGRTFHPDGVHRTPSMLNPYEPEIEVYENPKPRPIPRRSLFRRAEGERDRRSPRPNGRTTQNFGGLSPQVTFRDGSRIAICVRRKQRKEVFHAIGKAGRSYRKPRRYNRYSQVRC